MVRAVRGLLTVVGVLAASAAAAQTPPAPEPALLPPPAPSPPPGVITTLPHPAPVEVPPPPGAYVPGPPTPEPPPVDSPCFPYLLLPAGPRPGLFGSAEVGLLFPHVDNRLTSPVTIAPFGVTDVVRTPAAPLDVTVAPQFTLGYRLKDNLGAVQVSYRNLAAEGREVIENFDALGDGVLRSRLDLNTVTLSYSTGDQPLGALWGYRWELGARLATVFFDSQLDGQVFGLETGNHFVGAGPMVALDLTRELPGTGLALYSRVEAADLIGQIHQHFAERVGGPDVPDLPAGFGYASARSVQAVPTLGLQAGLSWLSHPDGRYRITSGFEWEHYWTVGKLGDSHAKVQAMGLFLRTEFNY